MRELKVTVLIENTVNSPGLLAEHGLSFYIQKDGHKYIFDTGQGFVLKHNLRQLGVDLGKVSSVILSHGHYDHTGGVGALLQVNPKLIFRGHPNLLKEKFKVQGKEFKEIGMPKESKDKLSGNIVFNTDSMEIEDGIYLTGELPLGQMKNREGKFKIWDDGYVEDTFREEQALYIKTPHGVVVFSGCSHNGIVETLQYIKNKTGEKIHTVLGGFHLIGSNDEEIQSTVEQIEKLEVNYLGLCHCTGLKAYCYFKNRFKERLFHCSTGINVNLLNLLMTGP